MAKTTTLILGGGFGGIAAANTLRGLLPHEHEIVVIDATEHHCVGAGHTWIALGERTRADVSRSRADLLARGVRFVRSRLEKIDVAARSVTAGGATLPWDKLVIALGAAMDPAGIPGLSSAETFYTLEGAERLRKALEEFGGGDVVLLIPRTPFKCPPAPYEMAILLQELFRRRGIGDGVRLSVRTVEGAPMTTAGPEMGKYIVGELASRGIAFHPQQKTSRVDPVARRIHFEDGSEAAYDLLIAVPPHTAPAVVREAGLLDASGWIPVDARTLEPKAVASTAAAGHVYAIGDVTQVPLPGRYKPEMVLSLPKAGVFAEAHGEIVGRRIAAQLLGRSPADVFDGEGFCYLELGGGVAVRSAASFFATPHPSVQKREPDAAQLRDKRDWVAAHLRPPA
ncbi:MAG: FAD/NAD(P)-binding oxidoreductase [bacterium]